MMHHFPTYCSASEMFTVNRVSKCAAVIRNLTFRCMSRLGLSSNALVCSIIDSDVKMVSRIRLHWMNTLDPCMFILVVDEGDTPHRC